MPSVLYAECRYAECRLDFSRGAMGRKRQANLRRIREECGLFVKTATQKVKPHFTIT